MPNANDNIRNRRTWACRGRVWIEGSEGTFFGNGRARLLQQIEVCGSISQAAKSLNMAYRRAWIMVDSMNRQSKEPLVELATGGKGGGGARVTPAGKRAIILFTQFNANLQTFLEREEKKFKL